MKHIVKLVAAALLLAVSLQPAMAGPSSRTVTADYGGEPSSIIIEGSDTTVRIFLATSPNVVTQAGERYVTVDIADSSGQPVVGAVHQGNAELGIICGPGERLPLINRKPLHVHLQTGMSTDCGIGSTPSEGTITFTFEK